MIAAHSSSSVERKKEVEKEVTKSGEEGVGGEEEVMAVREIKRTR